MPRTVRPVTHLIVAVAAVLAAFACAQTPAFAGALFNVNDTSSETTVPAVSYFDYTQDALGAQLNATSGGTQTVFAVPEEGVNLQLDPADSAPDIDPMGGPYYGQELVCEVTITSEGALGGFEGEFPVDTFENPDPHCYSNGVIDAGAHSFNPTNLIDFGIEFPSGDEGDDTEVVKVYCAGGFYGNTNTGGFSGGYAGYDGLCESSTFDIHPLPLSAPLLSFGDPQQPGYQTSGSGGTLNLGTTTGTGGETFEVDLNGDDSDFGSSLDVEAAEIEGGGAVVVRNYGPHPCVFAKATSGNETVIGHDDSCSFGIRVSPTTFGSHSVQLSVKTFAPPPAPPETGTYDTAPFLDSTLTYTADPATVTSAVTPPDPTPVGSLSAPFDVTLTASGGQTTIDKVAALPVGFGGSAGDFIVVSDGCSGGVTLVAGASCTMQFRFSPDATGPITGQFGIYTDGSDSSTNQFVSLSGTGTAASSGAAPGVRTTAPPPTTAEPAVPTAAATPTGPAAVTPAPQASQAEPAIRCARASARFSCTLTLGARTTVATLYRNGRRVAHGRGRLRLPSLRPGRYLLVVRPSHGPARTATVAIHTRPSITNRGGSR